MLCGAAVLPRTQVSCLSLLATGSICPVGPPLTTLVGPHKAGSCWPTVSPTWCGGPPLGSVVLTSVSHSQHGVWTDPPP